ncbi:putative PKS-NRPS protein [Ophiobolus disseminans]|uniref:Putative PKS-NRPS protein n=1 Tax=Ophiobolus disseminans TaxID=1469910 RepID=A0A6A7AH27_9PLEO|nr:putative PKS-NRPS protein [Ophiobolus disseminans]
MGNPIKVQEPIAIVGSSCRFPGGANSQSKLWNLLEQPRDVLREFDPERLNLGRFHHSNPEMHGSTNVINKSYILEEDTRLFDAPFFGISPIEAAGMDPQQRQLLETIYEAFESAGLTLEELKGSLTSVHVGTMTNDWSLIQLRDPETLPQYTATGTANSIVSNRISYVFDLKGPSVTIDTACSSSLVALHQAARGLLDGDSETAVVAGVNIILDPTLYITESKLHMLSPDARSRMWDKAANGYARGEGTAALVLKTLSKALADGDVIEGIVRSSGVNSDGQSPGITMPFAPTQAALIRHTYRQAGLDPVKDRPQYFECHGTGTPAGDPVEARAVSEAFGTLSAEDPLYVGSIKTVVGHLEGCAGLAGVIKVLLAIKHRVIPPNLLFTELNPAIAPYYGPLRIPTAARPWPELPPGTPARASVNSFGFGGTNAHAIIESFEGRSNALLPREPSNSGLGPLLFSAASGSSLLRTVQSHLTHLKTHPELHLGDVASLLQTRRTTHRVRTHFSGASRDDILTHMEQWIDIHKRTSGHEIGYQPRLVNPKEAPGLLAVFTGQGAQWPGMGQELLHRSPVFRKTIEDCEAILQSLPAGDAPSWSLIKELTADASTSRLGEAAIAQPLCTAVQLGLCDVLSASGIHFDAAVGHSSGEIAAAYMSGIINRTGAMQIAYYRGFHAKLATGAQGQRGGMMAVGMPLDKATLFCGRPQFENRLRVAASNALQSVTLSGDQDAIDEAKSIFDADGTFARLLKVDTAYHSHHMLPCAEPYLQSILACDIQVRPPMPDKCIWNSSVRGDTELLNGDLSELKGPYWVSNMVKTVLFSQAIESSIWHGGPFDLAVEIGPHPALKGPVEQTLKAVYGSIPLYTGVLKRGGSDVEAFSASIGAAWSQLGPSYIDFSGYHGAFGGDAQLQASNALKNLPSYAWDHDQIYWRESAISRRYRTGRDKGNELLGRRVSDDNEREIRWRNLLRLGEMPWLRGHEVLGEVLLPGAAYVSFAIEAANQVAKMSDRALSMIEVENVKILRPVVVPDDKDGIETVFTAHVVQGSANDARLGSVLRAEFSYYVCIDATMGTMVHACTGNLVVHFGGDVEEESVLPNRDVSRKHHTIDVDCNRIYSMFSELGLKYTGPFRALTESSRIHGYATATGAWDSDTLSNDILMHPALLDVAFQTLLVARAHPASGQTTEALLPSHIDRVRINPLISRQGSSAETTRVDFESWALDSPAGSLKGDINIYDITSQNTLVQVEGLVLNTVGEQNPSRDRLVFAKTVWEPDMALGLPVLERNAAEDTKLLQLTEDLERVALYYARRLANEVATDDQSKFQWYHQHMLEANGVHLALAAKGEHPVLRKEWLSDGPEIVKAMEAAHPKDVQLQMLTAVGSNFPQIVRGELAQLQVMTKDDLLNRFFMEDQGCIRVNQFLAETLRNITFKYPRCNILEIGAGTGGTTWSVLNAIGDAYASYTFTDISSAFLPAAAGKFADFAHKMIFNTLNVEKDPADQDYVPHSYEIVIAANVLHATANLERTMNHVRSMLRPGGYLLLFETTGVQNLSIPFIFSGLPSWWPGEEAERHLMPTVPTLRWNSILQDTGFSGLDMVMHDIADESKHTTALLVTQAVNDSVNLLREPLSEIQSATPPTEGLLLVGGKKLPTAKILSDIQKRLPRTWRKHVRTISCVDDIDELLDLDPGLDVICLHDLDEPLFASPMTASRLAALQGLLMKARNLVWVTGATTGKNHTPRAAMIHGVARVAPVEMPHLHMQVLGLEAGLPVASSARHCLEAFLRLREASEVANQEEGEGELMWALEPEMEVVNDKLVIPRVMADGMMNEGLAASKRTFTKHVDATNQPVQAIQGSTRMILQAAEDASDPSAGTSIQVQYTLHVPAVAGDEAYLVCGTSTTSGLPVMALSKTNTSVVFVKPGHQLPIAPEACNPATLAATADQLMQQAIVTLATPNQPALLYGADASIATNLAAKLATQGVYAYFATSDSGAPNHWIKLHERASKRIIERAVPHGIALYIDCSNSAASLPGVQVSSLVNKRYVVDWRKRESLELTTAPLDTQGLFRPDRTYLMVGAAGGLGFSLCKWALANGAKHMVITSRNPNIDPAELEDAYRAGAKVEVLRMDVTSKESVDSVIKQVRETMPPIAGVCNAAMVLSDKLFLDITPEQLNGTLAPKVDGSENLDAAFGDEPLDFFIMLSSSATVLGNIGQANYHIANLYMASLAANRRARGLAGSIIHVGHITDVGYVVESKDRTAALEEHFRAIRLMPCSETDVHHAFAQAIRGGSVGSNVSPDIIMGVEPAAEPVVSDAQEAAETKVHWFKNPRLGYLVPIANQKQGDDGPGGNQGVSAGSLKHRVLEADTEEQAVAAVLEAFGTKLEAILQLPAGRAVDNANRPIIDLGMDSLVAVEIRKWFLSELGAEISVVKVLGGDSTMQICTTAVKAVLAKRVKTDGEKGAKPMKQDVDVAEPLKPAPHVAVTSIAEAISVQERQPGATSSSAGSIMERDGGLEDSTTSSQDDNSTDTSASIPASTDGTPLQETEVAEEGKEPKFKEVRGKQDTIVTGTPKLIRQERMSRAQARIWFLSKHLEDPTAYNMVFHYRVSGPLNMMRLRHALKVTTQHHGCLRMCFYQRVGDGYAMQGLMASSAYKIEHIPDATDDDLRHAMNRLKTCVWDLEAGRTFKLTVLSRESEQVHDFVVGYHHIITDVAGLSIFLQDLDRAYRMQPLNKAAGATSHLDYTVRESEQEAAGANDKRLAFWRSEFATIPEPLSVLPPSTLRARPTQRAAGSAKKKIHSEYRTLTPSQTAAIKSTCAKLRISPFHLYLAVYQIMLARMAGSDDVCVGVVDANRGQDEAAAGIVGCFVNILPVQTHIGAHDKFSNVARGVSRKALAAFAHAGVPFEVLLDALNAPRWADGETPPLFQASLNYRGAGWGEQPLGADCRMMLTLDDGKDAEPPYDINLGVMDMADGFIIDLHCQSSLYSATATTEMTDVFLRLIEAYTADPDMGIDECSLHDEEQIRQALDLGKGAEIDFGWPATLSQRVLDMSRLHAADPAVTDGHTTISYAQLATRVAGASDALVAAGCTKGNRVASLCEPSVDSVVSMLSILQTDCVYVPLDTSLPVARMATMIAESKPSLLVYHMATKDFVQELSAESNVLFQELSVDEVSDGTPAFEKPCALDPTAAAIVLFTSGSTGKPKGIMLTQGNFTNHIALKTQALGLGRENVLQQSSLSFDMSLIQTFCALANGGLLVMASQDARRDPVELVDFLRDHRVSLTIATPSEYSTWMRYGSTSLQDHVAWTNACMGGEPVTAGLKREFRRLGLNLQLTNCYGPTEITAAATFQPIRLDEDHDGREGEDDEQNDQHDRVKYAVGRALPNYNVRIVDGAGRARPVNHTGEICIGGSGLALGYLGLPEQNRSKFFVDPMTGERLYRTGDQGRLLSDGTLLCFGRIDGDSQVKLRGLRVELEEVELAVLEASNGLLADVVVSKRGESLVAHAATKTDSQRIVNDAELRNILGRLKLPQYFIPAAIIMLPSLPTNANGKLDRKAVANLPLLPAQGDDGGAQETMNIREGELRLLWERVLSTTATAGHRIAPSSDFFLLGGNSMLLMRLQAAIRESIGVKVSTRILYRESTLSAMAQAIFDLRQSEAEIDGDPEDINWAMETAVPDYVKHQAVEVAPEDTKGSGLEIVLTGATSFLGGVLLDKLLQSATVHVVHCIAVTADDEYLLPHETDSRVRCYTGSLAEATLGLNAVEYNLLQQKADVIIHAGSNGHCLNNYATLQAPNVESTQRLAALALPRAVPLLFVSSNRVSLLKGSTEQPPESLAAHPPPGDGREGYTVSKWAAEVFLENTARYHTEISQGRPGKKWTAAVHRTCIMVGEQAPNSDSMNAILRFSLQMRCVPTIRRGRGFIDFAPVENVADELVDAALRMATGEHDADSSRVLFRHHSGKTKVPINEFAGRLEELYGGHFDAVDLRDWIKLATAAGIDPLITAYLDGVLDTDEEMVFPYLGAE